MKRRLITARGPAGGLAAVALQRVHEAVRAGDDQLVAVVAVEVGEHRRRLAVTGRGAGGDRAAPDRLRESVEHVLVAVQVEGSLVLAGHRGRRAASANDDL